MQLIWPHPRLLSQSGGTSELFAELVEASVVTAQISSVESHSIQSLPSRCGSHIYFPINLLFANLCY